jgi:hypothetical protein
MKNVCDCGLDISSCGCHLLILNGHGSHVNKDVVKTAQIVGLDLIMLPLQSLHAMQTLDVFCFKTFEQAFCLLRDVWTLRNKSKSASKEVLESWVFIAVEKAFTKKNIKSGFCTTNIFPFNLCTMGENMGPSEFYKANPSTEGDDLAKATAMDLAALENLQSINGKYM